MNNWPQEVNNVVMVPFWEALNTWLYFVFGLFTFKLARGHLKVACIFFTYQSPRLFSHDFSLSNIYHVVLKLITWCWAVVSVTWSRTSSHLGVSDFQSYVCKLAVNHRISEVALPVGPIVFLFLWRFSGFFWWRIVSIACFRQHDCSMDNCYVDFSSLICC